MRKLGFLILFVFGFITVVTTGLLSSVSGSAKKISQIVLKDQNSNISNSDSTSKINYESKRFNLGSSTATQIKSYLDQAKEVLLNTSKNIQTTDNLEFLRSERLSDDPTFETAVTPELRSLALDGLVKRFTRADWLFWKESLFPRRIKNVDSEMDKEIDLEGEYSRTSARIYIDRIKVKNLSLGKYLETAALLFSSLYLNTDKGRVFSVEEELYSLSTNAHILFRTRTVQGVSPRSNIDLEITSDPPFIFWLESLRASFIVLYCKREKGQIETQFELLSSINNTHLNDSVIHSYVNLFKISATSISPRFRDEIRSKFNDPHRESELASRSISYKNSLLNFNQALFDDAIIIKDIGKAKGIVLSLSAVFPEEKLLSNFETRIDELKTQIQKDSESLILAEKEQKNNNIQNDIIKTNKISILSDSLFNTDLGTQNLVLTKLIEKSGLIIVFIVCLALFVIKGIPQLYNLRTKFFDYISIKRNQINEVTSLKDNSISSDDFENQKQQDNNSISQANIAQVRSIKDGIQLREKKKALG